jgi:16S rRNA (cytosine967-C5)-methyltransferase
MEIEESLNNQKINFKKDTEIPFLYHISTLQRQNLMHNDFYKKNVLIFQDKASVTVAMIVDPQPEDLILDLTAAPGMKTILISQLANCQAKIIAIDIQSDRCRLMKELTQNLHSEDIHLLNADGLHPPFRVIQETRFNRILLDAPCTGSGTFLLSPDLKWQQNQQFLARNVLLQQKLLISALEYLNPGGFLIYSTCSLFPEEGEHQILQIQTDENWKDRIELNNLPNWILPAYTFPNLSSVGMGRLFPSIHHTQGFFIAKIRKKK